MAMSREHGSEKDNADEQKTVKLRQSTYPLFPSLCEDNNNPALPSAASSAHALYEANWALLGIKAYYKIDFPYIQTFFTDTAKVITVRRLISDNIG
ncbi:hypothetical protein A6R68_11420 [Neotoma lepida]|uniref:Uncharacterized protein n=1 Tax=Neotoma lepida TaxID=56216 RepID=A0A1A6FU25_NEOLE|nr:hypothetical protein A6R68_11420 [Neotoma lepida]